MAHFIAVLSDKITVDDDSWSYTVKNLPRESETTPKGLIKLISVTSTATKQLIQLSFTKAPTNRATSAELPSKLALISFADFRLRHIDKLNPEQTIPAPSKDSTIYIARLLQHGIRINGVTYNFFGHRTAS